MSGPPDDGPAGRLFMGTAPPDKARRGCFDWECAGNYSRTGTFQMSRA